jgi:hypothetical protein
MSLSSRASVTSASASSATPDTVTGSITDSAADAYAGLPQSPQLRHGCAETETETGVEGSDVNADALFRKVHQPKQRWHKMVKQWLKERHRKYAEWYVVESGYGDLDMDKMRDTTVLELNCMQIRGDDWLQLHRPYDWLQVHRHRLDVEGRPTRYDLWFAEMPPVMDSLSAEDEVLVVHKDEVLKRQAKRARLTLAMARGGEAQQETDEPPLAAHITLSWWLAGRTPPE